MAQNGSEDLQRPRSDYWIGDVVRVRGLRAADWEQFAQWNREPEWSWAESRSYPPGSPDRAQQWVVEEAKSRPAGDERRLIIERISDGMPVGTIDTNRCDRHARVFGYGVAVSGEHRRNGYASEAILLVLRFYFEELDYQKVNTSIWSFNEASIGLHERLGFLQEGRLRRTHFRGGRHWDELVVGMTREEFRERHGGSAGT